MSKRRLTKQQSFRIQKVQEERAARAQKKAAKAEEKINEGELGPEQEGRVIAHFGTQIAIEHPVTHSVQRCHMRANVPPLVTGDQVVWRSGDPYGVVTALLPRESLLSRPDAYGAMKNIAANIDTVVVVIAPEPEPFANLVDRYLVATELSGMTPVILLNKTDRINDDNKAYLESLLAIYPSLGYQVIYASTKTQAGLSDISEQLQNRTSIFVGQSGVGKSSLVNALLPEASLKVGELSKGKAKGTHTTTTAQLFHFPGGGDLIDSPGIREFGLWPLSINELAEGFCEIKPLIGYCRFRNCQHGSEPDCAIQNALEGGEISPQRYQSFIEILNSFAE